MKDVVTIQKTSKSLKGHILLCWLAIIASPIWMFAIKANAEVQRRDADYTSPLILLGCAITWYLITKFRIWWNHG